VGSPEARAASPLAVRASAMGKKASVYSVEVPSLMLFWAGVKGGRKEGGEKGGRGEVFTWIRWLNIGSKSSYAPS